MELDAQFHEIIARLSGSPRLLELAQTLRRHMLRYRIESIYTPDNVRRAIDGHKGILRAIRRPIGRGWDRPCRPFGTVEGDILRYALKETNPE